MPTRYLSILAVQEPFPIGLDDNNRVMFSCNYICVAAYPVEDFEQELARLLFDAGLFTLNVDGFIGPAAAIPLGDGPYSSIISTGGSAALETHDGGKYPQPSAQIITRALTYEAARTRARAIHSALDGQRNVTVAA
jgi:hypothetical protein